MGSAQISIYLDNEENPTELMTVTRRSSSLVMHVFDRGQILRFKNMMRQSEREGSSVSGVYILLSKSRAYVGQAIDIVDRIEDHDRDPSRGWWKRAVFMAKDGPSKNGLNKTELNYLEGRLIDLCRSGMLDTENSQRGNSDRYNNGTMAEAEKLISDAVQFLSTIGIDCIEPRMKQTKIGDIRPEHPAGSPPTKGKEPKKTVDRPSDRKSAAISCLNEAGASCTEDNTRYTSTGRIDIPLSKISKTRYIVLDNGGIIRCIELYTQSLGNSKTPKGGLKVYDGKVRLNLDADFVDKFSGINLKDLSMGKFTYVGKPKDPKKESK